jgi:hypothetical protein
MPRQSYVAKPQQIGERLTLRDGQGPHGSQGTRRTKGLSEAQIVQWERGLGLLYRTELTSRALDVKPE